MRILHTIVFGIVPVAYGTSLYQRRMNRARAEHAADLSAREEIEELRNFENYLIEERASNRDAMDAKIRLYMRKWRREDRKDVDSRLRIIKQLHEQFRIEDIKGAIKVDWSLTEEEANDLIQLAIPIVTFVDSEDSPRSSEESDD
jgi:hypothetical protein